MGFIDMLLHLALEVRLVAAERAFDQRKGQERFRDWFGGFFGLRRWGLVQRLDLSVQVAQVWGMKGRILEFIDRFNR